MKVIRFDAHDAQDSKAVYHEIADGQIIFTETMGGHLLLRRGWPAEHLIIKSPGPSLDLTGFNTRSISTVETIEEGLTTALKLGEGKLDLVAFCHQGTMFGDRVFRACVDYDGPYGTYGRVGWGKSADHRNTVNYFWRLRKQRKELFKDTAKKIGIAPVKLSNIISGRLFPVHALREQIAVGFDVPPTEIHALFENYHPSTQWPKCTGMIES